MAGITVGGLDPMVGKLANNMTAGLYGSPDKYTTLGKRLTNGEVNNPAMAQAASIASGKQLQSNPWLDQMAARGQRSITDAYNQVTTPEMALGASSAGRMGGGLYALNRNKAQSDTQQNLSDYTANFYGNAYNQERQNQMQALGLQGQLGQQGIQNQMSGAGMLNTANQQDINTRLAGAGLYQQGNQNAMQGIQLGANLNSQKYQDMNALLGVGNALQQAPWQPGMQYANIVGGAPGMGGGQTNPTYSNPLGNALGGALGGASIGGMTGLAGWTGVGGALGGLAGLFSR